MFNFNKKIVMSLWPFINHIMDMVKGMVMVKGDNYSVNFLNGCGELPLILIHIYSLNLYHLDTYKFAFVTVSNR